MDRRRSTAPSEAIPLKREEGDWRAAERRGVTDTEGRVVFPRAEGEALTLVITSPRRYATASTNASETSQTVRFPAPRSRTVEIRGANGKPAAGTLVRFAWRGWPVGITGPNGRMALPVPERDPISMVAQDSKGLRLEIVTTAEDAKGTDVPVVTLRSPLSVAGRVLDASAGEPVSGALVWTGGAAWTRTDAGGRFDLRAPASDQGSVEATATGRMLHVHHWQRERNLPITFRLEAAAAISGQVVDEAGKPVAGAQVATLPNPADRLSSNWEERKASTGPDGRFVLRKLPAGRLHSVQAVLEGFAPARGLADSTAPVRLILRRGALALGRVLSEEGRPLAGAQVVLMLDADDGVPGPSTPFPATADAEGRFRIPGVSAGTFQLLAESPGFAAALVEDVLIPEGEPRVDLGEVRLVPGGAIEGIVIDARGTPVERAHVMLQPSGPDGYRAMGALAKPSAITTGPDGRFRFEGLPGGIRFDLHADHAELLPEVVPGVEAPTPQPVRIRLSSPRSLAGRVVDGLGEPIAGASVSAVVVIRSSDGSTHTRSFESPARTDPEGRFVLSRVKPGMAELRVSAFGYRSREVEGIPVPEAGEAAPVEIALEPGTGLTGQVLDSQGLPLPRASVHAETPTAGQSVTADENGFYTITDLEPGPHEVEALAFQTGRSTRAAVMIRPGGNRFDIRFPAGVEVSGRVVDGQGAPVPGAGLSLVSVQQSQFMGPQNVSSADGSFVFSGVPEGEYRLTATRRGFGPSALPGTVRVEGAPVSGLELRLAPGAVIRGRILGLAPEDGPRTSVYAFSEQAGAHLQGRVESDGAYRVPDAARGDWHVVAQVSDQVSAQGTARIAEGEEEVVLDLEIPVGFTLSGRVLRDQDPLPGASVVVAAGDNERPRHGMTGEDGTFRIDRVPAGSYKLLVVLSTGVALDRTIEIDADQEITLEIPAGGRG